MDNPPNMVLAPCPFCGSADVKLNQVSTGGGWGVLCRSCHAYQDTRSENQELAITAWNRRSQPSLEGEVGEMVETIAHKEQIGIWANEIATAISLGDFLKEDWSFDDSVDLEREIVAQLRDVLSSAFSHPAYDIASTLLSQASQIEALRKERTNLIETKREQIDRLTSERDNLSSIVASGIDDIAGAELDELTERAEAAETKLAEAIKVIERIVECADRNYDRQNEKLADIAPMGRSFLDANGGGNG